MGEGSPSGETGLARQLSPPPLKKKNICFSKFHIFIKFQLCPNTHQGGGMGEGSPSRETGSTRKLSPPPLKEKRKFFIKISNFHQISTLPKNSSGGHGSRVTLWGDRVHQTTFPTPLENFFSSKLQQISTLLKTHQFLYKWRR